VQVYIQDVDSSVARPVRELKGFAKVAVKAGSWATAKVEIPLKYAASYWDKIRESWILEKGKYDLVVTDGTGTQEGLVHTIEVAKTFWWNGL